jgi:hypothetical protein
LQHRANILQPYDIVSGPDVPVGENAVTSLALALHECATIEYGALRHLHQSGAQARSEKAIIRQRGQGLALRSSRPSFMKCRSVTIQFAGIALELELQRTRVTSAMATKYFLASLIRAAR